MPVLMTAPFGAEDQPIAVVDPLRVAGMRHPPAPPALRERLLDLQRHALSP